MMDRDELERLAKTLSGVPLWGCLPGSPAARAGLCYGDVILRVNGRPTPTLDAFAQARMDTSGPLRVTYFRGGREYETVLDLEHVEAPSVGSIVRHIVDARLIGEAPRGATRRAS